MLTPDRLERYAGRRLPATEVPVSDSAVLLGPAEVVPRAAARDHQICVATGAASHAVGARALATVGWMEAIDELAHVHLPDSWVLSVKTSDSSVCFVLEAVLEKDHPRFYWPPKPGEQHAYARVRWCLHGEVSWDEGPNLDHPATDASGEKDYGNIDSWFCEGNVDHLEGLWGRVAVREARHAIEYLG